VNSPVISWCRHCGVAGQLTDEHIPPHSANNDAPVGRVVDPFDLASVVREVAEWSVGHVVSTLCLACNNRASNWGYVKEYRRWLELIVERARASVQQTNADPLRGTQPFEIQLPYDVQPARFVRQVLGMFLAVQATEHLFVAHPVLPELIGPEPSDDSKRRSQGLDIAPFRLYVSVCNANWSYCDRPMLAVEMNLDAGSQLLWTPRSSIPSQVDDALLLCLAPFAFILTTKDANDLGHDISDWARWSVVQRPGTNQRRLILPTAEQLQSALRAMVYPGDYVVHS
jgi:hypothetical protein